MEGTVYRIHWEQCDKEYVGETFIKNSSKGTYHNLELLSSFYLLDLINLQLINKNSDFNSFGISTTMTSFWSFSHSDMISFSLTFISELILKYR